MAIKSYSENEKKFYEVYVNGFDARGKRIQRRKMKILTLRTAQSIEFEFKKDLAQLRDVASVPTFEGWFNECLNRMKTYQRPSTIIGYQTNLKKWFIPKWKNLDLNQITKMQIYQLIFEEIDTKLSPYTRRKLLKQVRRIFQMAVEEGLLSKNPSVGIQCKVPEADQKVLTSTEVEIFLREAKFTNHRFYEVWAFALMTGMRSGEMFALRWIDIDFDSKFISVSRQWTSKNGFGPTKTQRSRLVPISSGLMTFLKELKMKSSPKDEFVLPRLNESENGVQAEITRDFCASVGITSVKFHDLRATFITNLLAQGESLARVMAIVGHTQLKTTNGYLRKAGVEIKGGTDKLSYSLPEMGEGKVLQLKKN